MCLNVLDNMRVERVLQQMFETELEADEEGSIPESDDDLTCQSKRDALSML